MVTLTIAGLFAIIAAIGGFALAKSLRVQEEGPDLVVFDGDREIARVQNVAQQPLDFLESFISKITTSISAKPDDAQLELKNPQDTNSVIYSISIAVDTSFETNGNFQVNVNGRKLARVSAGDLEGLSVFNIPIPPEGLFLQKSEKLEFFVWSDSGSVRATINVTIGDI